MWAKTMGGTSGVDIGNSIFVDRSGNVYTTGNFSDIVDFDPGPGTYYLTSEFLYGSTYSHDIFVSKLDASGNFVWAVKVGSDGEDFAYCVTLGGSNVYLTGQYQNTVDFDPGAGTYYLSTTGGYDVFAVTLGSSVLPVNLLSFEGLNQGNCNLLTWKTATEINNDYFTVEKSEDGILWNEIARKQGAGNSNTITTYNYRDCDLKAGAGTVYYRLKQTDIDGRYKYSGIIAIHIAISDDVRVTVFPNPATANNISLLIEGMKGEQAIIQLSDLSGKKLYSKVIHADSRQYSLNIDKDLNLSSGIYLLSVKTKNKFINQKLILQYNCTANKK